MNAMPNSSETIRTQLLAEMKDGIYADCDRLPRESVLSEKMGISRTQLRDILSALEREGFITRRHGVGTIINHHVLEIRNRMDISTEFLDIIRQNGYEPDIAYVNMQEETADEFIAGKLKIPVGTPVIRINRLCTADGKPAIYCEDVLDKKLVKRGFTLQDLECTIFEFMQKFCDVYSYMDLTELHAVTANDSLAQTLDVSVGTALLNFEELDFDIGGRTILYSREYFVDALFQHTVLRKKL